MSQQLFRASLLHFLQDPGQDDQPGSWQYWEDGLLWVRKGLIETCLDYAIREQHPRWSEMAAIPIEHLKDRLLLPGFVDTHLHYPQAGIIASYGRQLLDWLNHYTFPEEARFRDANYAQRTAHFVLDRLLANGTTTASVFATVHPQSVDAFMAEAQKRRLRMLCGKVMMDRHCPAELADTPARAEAESLALIERWHRQGRLRYSITPRFAPTSSPEQLRVAGRLLQAAPDLHLQTHLAENLAEIAWVQSLYPEHHSYLEVYHHFGLTGPRSIFGHAIHLTPEDHRCLAETGSAIAFCPTSNQFLGSGHFAYGQARSAGIKTGLGSDIGGGTSFSMLRTLAAAYTTGQQHHQPLPALRAFYLATLGGAEALGLADVIGNFQPGKEADFIAIDFQSTPELSWRLQGKNTLQEKLFALMTLGDDRAIAGTWILGNQVEKPLFHLS